MKFRILSNEDLPNILSQENERKVELAKLVSDQWLDYQQTQVEFVEPKTWLIELGDDNAEVFIEHFGWEGIVFDDDKADLEQAEIDLLGLDTVYDGRLLSEEDDEGVEDEYPSLIRLEIYLQKLADG